MNGLLIAVLVILIGATVIGYWRGFVRIAFSLIAMILMIVLVSWFTPYVTDFFKENTSIYEELAEKCARKIQESAETQAQNSADYTGEAGEAGSLAGIQLPEIWTEQILQKAGAAVNQLTEESGIYQAAGAYIADWVIRGISFFAAFFLIAILLRLVVGLLDIVARLPVIKGVNRLLGGAAGFLQGLLVVWLLLFLITIACTSQLGQTMLGYVRDSELLTYLYQHNGILYFLNFMLG